MELHVRSNIGSLSLVWRNDTNLTGHDARFEEFGDHLFHVGRLGSIEERSSARRDLFGTQVLMEKHGRLGDRPGEIDVLSESLGCSNTILQGSLVKHVGREFGKTGVHSVLDRQSDRSISQNDETFKERLSETGARRLFVHDDGTELLMIADQYDLFTTHDEGDHTF